MHIIINRHICNAILRCLKTTEADYFYLAIWIPIKSLSFARAVPCDKFAMQIVICFVNKVKCNNKTKCLSSGVGTDLYHWPLTLCTVATCEHIHTFDTIRFARSTFASSTTTISWISYGLMSLIADDCKNYTWKSLLNVKATLDYKLKRKTELFTSSPHLYIMINHIWWKAIYWTAHGRRVLYFSLIANTM